MYPSRKIVRGALAFTLVCLVLAVPPSAMTTGQVLAARNPAGHWRTLLSTPAVQAPTGLAIDTRGRQQNKWAYVADAATGRIVKFGTGGTVLRSWSYGEPGNDIGMPAGIAVGGKGNVFVADPATGTISKFSPSGVRLRRWKGFGAPRGFAVGADGGIYVAEYSAHTLTQLYGGGGYVSSADTYLLWQDESVGKPVAVALDPRNRLVYWATVCTVAVDCGSFVGASPRFGFKDSLVEWAMQAPGNANPRKVWFGLGHSASGQAQESPNGETMPFVTIDSMVTDSDGNLYVAGNLWPPGERQGRGVEEFTPLGHAVAHWYLPSRSPVSGIAQDNQGAIYVSQGDRVLRLDSQ